MGRLPTDNINSGPNIFPQDNHSAHIHINTFLKEKIITFNKTKAKKQKETQMQP